MRKRALPSVPVGTFGIQIRANKFAHLSHYVTKKAPKAHEKTVSENALNNITYSKSSK